MRLFSFVLICVFAIILSACGRSAKLSVTDGMGPKPLLPPPKESIIPTVHIATAVGWPSGVKPQVTEGLTINILAGCMLCQMVMCWWRNQTHRQSLIKKVVFVVGLQVNSWQRQALVLQVPIASYYCVI